MPRTTGTSKPQAKDMYWFAHGGIESSSRQPVRSTTPGPGDTEDESSENGSLSWKVNSERRAVSEEPISVKPTCDQDNNVLSGTQRPNFSDKRQAVEERKRLLLEAEQEKNNAIMKKHVERGAAFEAKRNAQRSNIAFAFGSVIPRNSEVDAVRIQHSPEIEKPRLPPTTLYTLPPKTDDRSEVVEVYVSKPVFPYSCLTGSGVLIADNIMSQSMFSTTGSARGRRKNDLTPTVPFDRTGPPRAAPPTRKRSVSMSRLDQLAQPRRAYVEAQKANSTISNSSSTKDANQSPTRPLSVASEKSMNKAQNNNLTVIRRPPAATRKPRPVSIAGTIPDHQPEKRTSRSNMRNKKSDTPITEVKTHTSQLRNSRAKSSSTERTQKPAKPTPEKVKSPTGTKTNKLPTSKAPAKHASSKQSTPKLSSSPKQWTPKTSPARKLLTNKKQAAMLDSAAVEGTNNMLGELAVQPPSPLRSSTPDEDSQSADEKSSGKRIISEEEAKTALAEKRRLAREQAEKEAELERQRQEELRQEEEERLRLEEEEHKKMEEEQLKLQEEHRKFEEEKLRKAIEEQERKEEEEKVRREEDARFKAEQEKKAKEEAEKQRVELEEKLKKEEGERAERKKRLEKIMSRTRGKSGTASPGSASGSEAFDSTESQPEILSSEPNSLDSNIAVDSLPMDNPVLDEPSGSESYDYHQTINLDSHSLSSNDLMMPSSGHTSLDGGLLVSEHPSLEVQQGLLQGETMLTSCADDATSEGEEVSSAKTEVAVEMISREVNLKEFLVPPNSVLEDSSIESQIINSCIEDDTLVSSIKIDSANESSDLRSDDGHLAGSAVLEVVSGTEEKFTSEVTHEYKDLSLSSVQDKNCADFANADEGAHHVSSEATQIAKDHSNTCADGKECADPSEVEGHQHHVNSTERNENQLDHLDNSIVENLTVHQEVDAPTFEMEVDYQMEKTQFVEDIAPMKVDMSAVDIKSTEEISEVQESSPASNIVGEVSDSKSCSNDREQMADELIQPTATEEFESNTTINDLVSAVKVEDITLLPKDEDDSFCQHKSELPVGHDGDMKQLTPPRDSRELVDSDPFAELQAVDSSEVPQVVDSSEVLHAVRGNELFSDYSENALENVHSEDQIPVTGLENPYPEMIPSGAVEPSRILELEPEVFLIEEPGFSNYQTQDGMLLPDPVSDMSDFSNVLNVQDLPPPNVFLDQQTNEPNFKVNESDFVTLEDAVTFNAPEETTSATSPFADTPSLSSNQAFLPSDAISLGTDMERFADHGVLKTVDEMNFTNLEETNKNTDFLYPYEEEAAATAVFGSQKMEGEDREKTLDFQQSLHDQNLAPHSGVNQLTDNDTQSFIPKFDSTETQFRNFAMDGSGDITNLEYEASESNDVLFPLQKTLTNPFGDSMTENVFASTSTGSQQVLSEYSESGFGNELLMSALNSAIDESEDSSLDSNLSQVLNVDSTVCNEEEMNSFNSKLEVLNNGPSTADSAQTNVYDKDFSVPLVQQDESFVPKTNGFNATYNNGSLYGNRFESAEIMADQTPVLPKDMEQGHPISEKGVNANISIVGNGNTFDNVDNVNSNKITSNPFLIASNHQFSGNPFETT